MARGNPAPGDQNRAASKCRSRTRSQMFRCSTVIFHPSIPPSHPSILSIHRTHTPLQPCPFLSLATSPPNAHPIRAPSQIRFASLHLHILPFCVTGVDPPSPRPNIVGGLTPFQHSCATVPLCPSSVSLAMLGHPVATLLSVRQWLSAPCPVLGGFSVLGNLSAPSSAPPQAPSNGGSLGAETRPCTT
jgi:hypothetical protein